MPPTPDSLAKAGSEAAHQTALFCWAALEMQQRRYPQLKLMFHVPNGGSRHKAEAGQLKAQGVKAGVPDIFLPIPKGNYHGFFIEMKIAPNTVSEDQQLYIGELRKAGYAVAVAWSWLEASRFIEWYLGDSVGTY